MGNPPSPPLVGRQDELARIDHLLREVAQGRGGVLVLVGDAGLGKTALVGAASVLAETQGIQACRGACPNRSIPLPLVALHDALGLRRGTGMHRSTGGAADTGWRHGFEAAGSAAPAHQLVEEVRAAAEAAAGASPTLLVVEDLHWADPLTVEVVDLLGAAASDVALAIVVTTRPPVPGTAAARLVNHWRSDTVTLGPLTGDDLVVLATRYLGRKPDADVVARLGSAGGNPLLAGVIVDAPFAGPRGLEQRVLAVEAPALAALQVAAIVGTEPDADTVARLAGLTGAELAALLDELAQAGIIGLTPRLAFRHELWRDAVLSTLSATARRLLHLDAARYLARRGAPAIEVAEHYLVGATPGDPDAVRWLREAADDLVAHAPATALQLVTAALAIAGLQPDLELLRAHVRALVATGDAAAAKRLAQSLLHEGLPPEVAAALHRELAFACLILGQARESREAMERSAALDPRPEARARASAEVAFGRLIDLDLAGAAEAAEAAVAGGRRGGDVAAQVGGGGVRCWTELFAGNFGPATRLADEITVLAEQPHVRDGHLYQPWFIAGLAYLEADRHDDLARATRRGRTIAATAGYAWSAPGYDALDAFGHLRRGELADAATVADATLGYLNGIDGFGVALWCHGFLAQIALHHGDEASAVGHLEVANAHLASGRAQFGLDQMTIAAARLAEARGDLSGAYKHVRDAWDLFGAIAIPSARQELGTMVVRLGLASGALDDAAAVLDQLDATASRAGTAVFVAFSELACAWVDGDAELAVTAAERLQSVPSGIAAAGAWADAGTMARRKGVGVADGYTSRAVELYRSCGADADAARVAATMRGRRPPLAERQRFGWEALTPTELAVARLVSDGLANAAIAEQLGISRRTIESHMGSIYRKLEISTRVDLVLIARNALTL